MKGCLLLFLSFLLMGTSGQTVSCDPGTYRCSYAPAGGINTTSLGLQFNVSSFVSFPTSAEVDIYVRIKHSFPMSYMQLVCGLGSFQRYLFYGVAALDSSLEIVPAPQVSDFLDGVLYSVEAEKAEYDYATGEVVHPLTLRPWMSYTFAPKYASIAGTSQYCSFYSHQLAHVDEITAIYRNVGGNPCETNPCKNGGVCSPTANNTDFTCDCSGTGFAGPRCGGCLEIAPADLFLPGGGQFSFSLNTQPSSEVTVRIYSDCLILDKCTLTFTPENWNTPQNVNGAVYDLSQYSTPTGNQPAYSCKINAIALSSDLCHGSKQDAFATLFNPIGQSYSSPGNTASSTGDPHFRTFDGIYHHFYDVGDFYFIRGLSGTFAIQTRQESCGGGRVACNTGVAIKFGSVIVYFSSKSGVPEVSVVGDAVTNQISVTGSGSSYKVKKEDSGIEIEIRFWQFDIFIMDVYATLPSSMKTQVAGLAGFFNGDPSDDYAQPSGVLSDEISFHQSWRIPQAEDLFISPSASIPDISSNFVITSNPPEVRYCTYDASSGDTGKIQQGNGTSPFQNEAVPSNPNYVVPSCYDNATLLAEAEAACDVYFEDSVAQCCKNLGVNATGSRETCVCDYVLSGTDAFVISAVEAFYSECNEMAAALNTTCEPCPSACSGNGACGTGGVCTCNSPFQGDDCSENWGLTPVVVSASQNSGSGCPRTVTVSGNYFFGTELSCEFNVAGTITTKAATKITNFQLICDLPPFTSQGSVSLSVKVIRSDTAMSSSFSFDALPSCCDGLCVRGTCTNDNVNGFTCSCPSGYEGDFCETLIPTTQPPTTQPPTTQPPTTQPPTTQPPTTQPPTTQPPTTQPPLPCDSSPCLNAGVCTNVDASSFNCSCPSGISGDVCEFAGPVVNLDITTSSLAGAKTNSEILVTFVGSTGTSGPHSLGSFPTDGANSPTNPIQLSADIGELYALDLQNTGGDMWRVESIEVTGELTGSFGWDKKVRTTKTLELPFTISYQTKSGVDDGCAAGVYIRIIDVNGVSPPEFALFGSTTPGEFNQYDIPYLNLAEIKKIQLGSFTEDTWDFDFITITRRGVTYTFTNTLGAPFSRTYQLAQFFPQ